MVKNRYLFIKTNQNEKQLKYCPLCNNSVEHLKKHIRKEHPEEYEKQQKLKKTEVIRNHTCPVAYLQNYSQLSSRYINSYSLNPPKRSDYLIYTHDKVRNSPIQLISLNNIGIKKRFYYTEVENYLESIEQKVAREFKTIREMNDMAFINPYLVFRYLMSQLVRTPKFQQKLISDLKFLQEMSNEEYNQSLMKLYHVPKPKLVNKEMIKNLQADMIRYNTLEKIYKWSRMVLITNHTSIPLITSDSPTLYNNLEFICSYLENLKRVEFSLLTNQNSIFYFPIDSNFGVMIGQFDNTRNDAYIDYEDIFDENQILILNMLMYQFSERFIFTKEEEDNLIRKIRNICGNELNKDYQTLEFSYNTIKKGLNQN